MQQENNPTLPVVPELKKPTFEAPIQMIASDIKSRTGNIPPISSNSNSPQQSQSFLGSALAQANKVNNEEFAFNNYDVDFEDAFVTLDNGDSVRKFDNFLKDVNNEDRLAKQQTTGEKWGNGLKKFGVKTGTAILGGTIGTVEGIINGVNQGSFEAVYDSDFNNWLDDVNKKMDYKLPNYYTEQEKQKGFGASMGTANFWANDVLGGLSFTVGTIVSEGIWAAATGGTSLIARGANLTGKLANWSSKSLGTTKTLRGLQKATKQIKKPYINASKTKKVFDQARFLTTSAGYESGFEARHYMKETEQEFISNFEKRYNRKPSANELGDFKNGLTDSGNAVFATNMALVGFSNQVVLGKMLLGKTTTGAVKNNALKRKLFGVGFDKLEDGTFKALTPNKYQKLASRLYGFGKPAITEGFIEEGGQSVTSSTAKNYMLSAYSDEGTKESLSLTESFYDALADTYGTKEGFKEVGIGMIIGVLGGGASSISSGQGLFNEVGQERAFIEDRVNYRNQFTSKNVIERFKANNKIFEANRRSEKAKQANDLTNELLSERDVMIASIERDYHFEGLSEGFETFSTAMQGVDNSLIAEEMGISEEEAQQWKDDKVAKYSQISNDYSKNKRFAESLLGTGQIAGLDKSISKGDIEKAIAYNLTMANESDNLANEYVARIKEEIGTNFTDSTLLDVLDVDNLLRKVDEQTEKSYIRAITSQKALLNKRQKLEKSLREVQTTVVTPENKVANTERLGAIQEKLIEVEQELGDITAQKELIINTMELQFPDSNEIVTEEMLDNQTERASKLDNLIESLKVSNPEKYGRVHKLLQEYQKATKVTRQFQKTSSSILDPKLRITEINGWVDKLVKKNKGINDFSEKFFTDLMNQYSEDIRTNLEDNIASEAAVNSSEGINEGVDDITSPTQQTEQQEVSQTQSIKKLIDDIASTNKYIVDYFGQDQKEILKTRPNKKDLDKYSELLKKIQPKNKNSVVLSEQNPKNSGLTNEEFDEMKQLNEKLADWKLLEGAVDSEGNSISGLVELLDQLQGIEVKETTKTELENKDFIKLSESIEKQKAQKSTASAVQTPDVALVNLKDDGISNREVYEFSHLKVDSFERLIPNSKLYFLDSNGVKKDFSNSSESVQKKISSTVGSKFVLETPNKELSIKLKEFKRLEIPAIDFNEILPESNLKILNFGVSKFLSVYEKINDTEFIPLQGDFKYESVQKNEVIEIDINAISQLKSGDILRLEVNTNDTFNQQLLNKFKRDGNKKALESQMQVYVTTQKGQIVGSLRAFSKQLPDSPITDKLIQARARAVEMVLESKDSAKVDLKSTVPVNTVLTGAPKLNLEEQTDGTLKPKDLDFSLDAIREVKAVGYSLNGKINLDKPQNNSKLNTIFVDNLTDSSVDQVIPIIVFESNNQDIAFPITLKETQVDRSVDVLNILRTDLSSGEKLSKIYGILAENGVDPNQFNIDISDNNWMASDGVQDIMSSLRNVRDYANVTSWVEGNYNYNQLIRDAAISIDITNNPFQTGKIILSMSDLQVSTDTLSKEQITNSLDEVEDLLSQFAIEVDKEMRNNPVFVNVDNSFTQVFDENAVEDRPNSFQKKKNVKIVKESLGKTVSKNIQDIFGKEKVSTMRKLVKKHIALSKQRAKQLTDIKNSKLKSEVDSQKKSEC